MGYKLDEQAKGVSCPNTDNWIELYNGKPFSTESQIKYSAVIEWNRFKAEVDGTVAQVLDSAQRRQFDNPAGRL